MAEEAAASGPRPIVPYLKIPESGDPYLEAQKCRQCGAFFLGERETCSSCGTSGQLEAVVLSNRGELYVYSIVHRSFPGVQVPFVSAVVDLEGGGTVKGNLIVEVIYQIAPTKDREGNEYLTYYFQPRS
jgi:uncharacterized OB-fold protein